MKRLRTVRWMPSMSLKNAHGARFNPRRPLTKVVTQNGNTEEIPLSQTVLLDDEWLANQVSSLKLPYGMNFTVEKSPKSKTRYITFCYGDRTYASLRVSDHMTTTPHKTFLVTPSKKMTVNKRTQFLNTVKNVVAVAQTKYLRYCMKKVENMIDNKK